ncbi:MAG: hypothetical protein U9M89_02435 [Patescibacteria group bacterium]|nr:hypothetical protein [Patescibacteria group bacterium]
MKKKQEIIDFDGMQFNTSRRARLLKSRQWKTRRQIRNRLGIARNLRSALTNLIEG